VRSSLNARVDAVDVFCTVLLAHVAQKDEGHALMAGFFGPPSMPTIPTAPPTPSISDDRVQQAASEAQKKQQQASGRASTYLTDPQSQRTAQQNEQRYLGAA
jgi:hypothetical protein